MMLSVTLNIQLSVAIRETFVGIYCYPMDKPSEGYQKNPINAARDYKDACYATPQSHSPAAAPVVLSS